MKLRLPNKLIAALMSAMSAAVFTTLATGTTAYGSTTYDDLTTSDYFEANANVYNTGKGTFYLETESCDLSLTLTLNLNDFAAYQAVHDYANSGYYSPFVTWTYNNNAGATYGMADVSSGYNGVSYSGVTGMWAGSPWSTGTNITFDESFRTNYADANGNVTLTITNTPVGTTNNVVVTAVNNAGAQRTLYTANGLRSQNYVSQHITSFSVNMNYVKSVTLNTESTLDSSTFTPPKDYTTAFESQRLDDTSVGRIVFMGDSITHGVNDMSWRWGLFKTFVDNGIENEIAGPLSGYHSNPRNGDYNGDYSSSTYGYATFDNVHYAQASGRTHNMLTAGSSVNALGNSTGVNYGGVSSAKVGKEYNADTYAMMIGTNDFLSDSGAWANDENIAKVTNRLLGEGAVENGVWVNADVTSALIGAAGTDPSTAAFSGKWGTMGQIIDNLRMSESDTMYIMSVPVWGHTREGLRGAAPVVEAYNTKLELWATAYSTSHTGTVKYVDINKGLQDKTLGFFAPDGAVFFRTDGNDYIHPNEQGALIIAGNLAKGMGLAGRTAGLNRADSHTANTTWTALDAEYVLNAGDSINLAQGALSASGGYTVDFNGVFGNGATDGWLAKDNALSVSVGDGSHTGTLNLSEGYISWGNTILYCQDNSAQGNETLRLAYHTGDSNANIASGYYVWLGDMLIGQALTAGSGSQNGITLSATGAQGTISGLTYSNTAYAPTTSGITSVENAYRSTLDITLDSHNNTPTGSNINWTGAVDKSVAMAAVVTNASAFTDGKATINVTGTGTNFFGATNITATGNVEARVDNQTASTAFAALGGKLTGDVTMEFSDSTVNNGTFGTVGGALIGSYSGASITGTFAAYIDNTDIKGDILGGALTGAGSIGGVNLVLNSGTVSGVIYGGSKSNGTVGTGEGTAIGISVAGGTISGTDGVAIVGSGTAGTVNGDIDITITGGVIKGDIIGRQATGVTYGENTTASVTVEGNLAQISGNITADSVTLKDVYSTAYSDSFDKYRGTITASDLVLDGYAAGQVNATLVTDHVHARNNTYAAIHNLTLRNCSIEADETSMLTLGGDIHSGNTISYSGNLYLEDNTSFQIDTPTAAATGGEGYQSGVYVYQVEDGATGHLFSTDGAELTAAHTATYTGAGAQAGYVFSYQTETGSLLAYDPTSAYNIISSTVDYSDITTASSVTMSGGQLNLDTNLSNNVTINATGGTVNIGTGVELNIASVTATDAAKLTGVGTLKLASNGFGSTTPAFDEAWSGSLDITQLDISNDRGLATDGNHDYNSKTERFLNFITTDMSPALPAGTQEVIVNTTGEKFIQLGGGSGTKPGSNIHFAAATIKMADFTLADWSGSRTWHIGKGSALEMTGRLWMDWRQTLLLDGGSLKTTHLDVGRGGYEGGDFVMSGDSAKLETEYIKTFGSDARKQAISITGGTLSFTQAANNVLQSASTLAPTVTIGGTTADHAVHLDASKSAWTMSFADMNLQHLVVDAASNNITIGAAGTAMNVGASIENKGKLTLAGNASIVTAGENLQTQFGLAKAATTSTYSGTGTYAGSGFLQSTDAQYYLVKSSGAGTLDATGLTLTNGTRVTEGDHIGANDYVFTLNAAAAGQHLDNTYYINSALTYNAEEMSSAAAYEVAQNTTFTVANNSLTGKDVVLNSGATLKSSGGGATFNAQQIANITLTGNATVNAGSNFGLIGSASSANPAFAPTTLDLNEHQLTVQGGGRFALFNTTVTEGTILVDGGKLQIGHGGMGVKRETMAEDTLLKFANGGAIYIAANAPITVEGLSGTGTIDRDGGDADTVYYLTIDADNTADEAYSFSGAVAQSLALTMKGTGYQTINLTAARTLNSVTVQEDAHLTLSGSKATITNLNLQSGTLAYDGSKDNIPAFTNLTFAKGATLDLTQVTDMFDNNADGNWASFKNLAAAVSGEGTVLLPTKNANDSFQIVVGSNGGDAVLSANYIMDHRVTFNNYKNVDSPTAANGLVISENGSLQVNGALGVVSSMKVTVNGGSLTADSLTLGHTETGKDYFGNVTVNSGSLTLNGQITAAAGHAGNAVNVLSGTFTYNADGDVFANNNRVAVTIGGADADHMATLVADGHDWTLNHDATLGHVTIQTANNGWVTIGADGTTTTLTGMIYNDGGMSLAGTVNVAGTLDTSSATFSEGEDHSYGYLTGVHKKIVEGNGRVDTMGVTEWTLGGLSKDQLGFEYADFAAGYLNMSEVKPALAKRWFMNTGVGGSFTYTAADDQEMDSFVINAKHDAEGNRANLTLNTQDNVADHLNAITVNDTTADITIAANTVLASSVLSTANDGSAVLQGSGTYDLGMLDLTWGDNAPSLGAGVSLDNTGWTGAVRLSGTATWISRANLDRLTAENSWVEMAGLQGFFDGTDNTIDANIIFTNATVGNATYAFKQTNGFKGKDNKFSGKLKGEGTFVTGYTANNHSYSFSGDASEWTGTFLRDSNGNTTTVNISNRFGAEIKNTTGTMDINLTDDATAQDAFTGDLTVTGGTVNVNGALNSTRVDARINGGTLNLKDGGTMGSLYSNGTSSINIGTENGAQNVTLSVTRIELGDMNANATSTMTVQNNATLLVTGSTNNTNVSGYKTDSIVIGEWNANSTVNVKGTLLADKADLLIGDTGSGRKATVNIAGGTLAVKGVNAGSTGEGRDGHLELNVTDGGKLILGADGYYTRNVTWGTPVVDTTVLDGTIGISADSVVLNKGMAIGDVTFDTQKYAVSTADGGSVAHTDSVGSIEVSGDITAATGVDAPKMTVTGGGSVYLNTTNVADLKKLEVAADTLLKLKANTSVSVNELVLGNVDALAAEGGAAPASTPAPVVVSDGDVNAHITVTGTQEDHGTLAVGIGGTDVRGIDLTVNGHVDYSAIPGNILNLNGGSLTLSTAEGSSTIMLSDALLAGIGNTDPLALFTGISSLTIDGTSYNPGDLIIGGETTVLANVVFANSAGQALNGQQYTILFRTDGDGTGTLLVTPEPATAALSLLALAALAARRKRK